jgi:hypothetical protein
MLCLNIQQLMLMPWRTISFLVQHIMQLSNQSANATYNDAHRHLPASICHPQLHALPADILEAAKNKTDTSNIGDKVTGAADDAKDKAKGLLKSKGISALPANPLAAVADQNADVRDAATGYRDPAGAVQLDAASGESRHNSGSCVSL